MNVFGTPEATLLCGDSREVLKSIPDNSIHSIVTDPPYALVSITKRFGKPGSAPVKVREGASGAYKRASSGFMSVSWDTGEVAFEADFWAECLRVLKPGGHVVSFGGTRSHHWMWCAIENAGFEIRDSLLYLFSLDPVLKAFFESLDDEQRLSFLYILDQLGPGGLLNWGFGTGFPKSHNQKGEFDGWGTALKPGWEVICLARKPLEGTVAANLATHRTGAINIDGCRVEYEDTPNPATNPLYRVQNGYAVKVGSDSNGSSFTIKPNGGQVTANSLGRWPANVLSDGSDAVVSLFPSAPGQQGRARTGGEAKTNGIYGAMKHSAGTSVEPRGDSGSAARFFWSPKANREDRAGSSHPTIKPIALMRYLCRLVTPPGGTILDPFAGTGTTGQAALAEGFDAILIEREVEYQKDIRRRLGLAEPDCGVFG